MTTDAETVVRRAYDVAEGSVMDVPGFIDLFTDDGVIHAGLNTYRGKDLGHIVVFMGSWLPTFTGNSIGFTSSGTSSPSSCRSGAPSAGCSSPPQASSRGMEPSSTPRPRTSGTWKTARSRSSTATWGSASCSDKWAYSPTS